MASEPQYHRSISASETWVLGDGSEDRVSRWAISIADGGSSNHSVLVKGRVIGSGLPLPARPWITIGYFNFATMADVAGTALTSSADALILVDCSGLEIELVITISAGEVDISAKPLIG